MTDLYNEGYYPEEEEDLLPEDYELYLQEVEEDFLEYEYEQTIPPEEDY